ncbi:MAG TPA: LamG-like jellyroll fold domain-containing protein [Polyangiaceae bacterium]
MRRSLPLALVLSAVGWGCESDGEPPAGGGSSPPSSSGTSTGSGGSLSAGEAAGVGGTPTAGGGALGNTASGAAGGSSGGGALGGTGGGPGGTGVSLGGTGGGPGGTGVSMGGSGGGPGGAGGSLGGSGGSAVDGVVEELLAEFVAYWDFETVAGQAVLPRVGSVPLELAGASVAAGTSGTEFVTSGAGATAMTAAPVLDTSQDFSVAAWVKLDQLDGYDTFVGMDGAAVSSFFLQKRDNERLAFATFSSDAPSTAACVATGELRPRAGEWYFVVGTYSASSGEQRIYVDGMLSGQATCAAGVFQASGGLSVGRGLYDGVASDPWSGALDDLGLVARVLTPTEIAALYRYGRPNQHNYLFAYFVEVSQGRGDGLRLAHSHDGRHWGAIGGGKVFMPASVGGGSFRDPHLLRTPDGLYHLVWTTSCVPWAEAGCVQDRGLGHATSPDLVTWSAADYITVELNVEHVWAPETFYDDRTGQVMLFWSSPIDATSNSDPHDIYYVLTSDFQTFTEPAILYSRPGRNFIDATIYDRGDEYLMVIKDEADGQKNLRALVSQELSGPDAWNAEPSAPLTGNYAAEGPSFLERDGSLFIYFDKYGEGAYGALEASTTLALDTPAAWSDISASVFFPGVRHGTPIEVPWEVFEAVAVKAGD